MGRGREREGEREKVSERMRERKGVRSAARTSWPLLSPRSLILERETSSYALGAMRAETW